jgi:hypothetical protein
MLTAGPIAFAAPWALVALAALPALWWLLRLTPPAPQTIAFPPLRLLLGLSGRDQTAARTPLWLLLLRLALAMAVIVAAARPLLNPHPPAGGSGGPLLLAIDNGWASAAAWPNAMAAALDRLQQAERQGHAVTVIATAATAAEAAPPPPPLVPAAQARQTVQAMAPQPWATDRSRAADALLAAAAQAGWGAGEVVWISDGLEEPAPAPPLAATLARVRSLGRLTVMQPAAAGRARLLRPAGDAQQPLATTVVRPAATGAEAVALSLLGHDGTVLERAQSSFAAGARQVVIRPDIPAELAARLARIQLDGPVTAGAVLLADDRWQRRAVGLVAPRHGEQPLLSPLYYVERALAGAAEVRRGSVAELLSRELAMLVLAGGSRPDAETTARILQWVANGGVLLRFADAALAAAEEPDPLLPVRLRASDRALGGALSWGSPGQLAPLPAEGPFSGLAAAAEIEVHRQVLAEPDLDVDRVSWARLQDGTPLITGRREGRGWLVLVHTTANAEWSTLPLSGLFVQLLKRIADLGHGSAAASAGTLPLPPAEILNGFAVLGPPPPGARSLPPGPPDTVQVSPQHPPGLYGREAVRFALNLSAGLADPVAVAGLPADVTVTGYETGPERDLRPWLWTAALLLALADLMASLKLRGLLKLPRMRQRQAATAIGRGALLLALALGGAAAGAAPALAAPAGSEDARTASLQVRLAYVRTGNASVDAMSEAGLRGLTAVLNARTAVDLAEPAGVDPEQDELAFYPLLYWALDAAQPPASPAAARRLQHFMQSGGTILFDSRGDADPAALRLQARALALPALTPLPSDHVLRRSYYLLDEMPGRWAGRPVWIEPAAETVNDGVATVIAGSADWAGAWAIDRSRRPMLAVVPGGERQRELAYRFGVNVVMYALTGNYKADQVHLPAIMERLQR